jgi:hypothetical protein
MQYKNQRRVYVTVKLHEIERKPNENDINKMRVREKLETKTGGNK